MKRVFVAFCIVFSFVSCSKYNTNIEPPIDSSTVDMVFPKKISGKVGELSLNPSFDVGVEYVYKNLGTIWVYNASTDEAAIEFFQSELSPLVSKMPSKFQWRKNNYCQVMGKESGRILFAWNNQKWLFMIKAKDKRSFKKIVRKFIWIEKK